MKMMLCIFSFCLLSACTTLSSSTNTGGCDYRERDLTVNWSLRHYWCVPGETQQSISTHRSSNRK